MRNEMLGSKIILLVQMLKHTLHKLINQATNKMARQLGVNLSRILSDKLSGVETPSIFSLVTLLDPRFKTLGFHNPANAKSAVCRLKSECAASIRNSPCEKEPSTSTQAQPEPAASSQGKKKSNLY